MKKKLENNALIIFLGSGSYNFVKNKKNSKGLFWTLNKNGYLLLDSRTSTLKESSFDSYSELVKYCKEKFPESHITT